MVKQFVQDQIVEGTFPVGSALPSVRRLSAQMGINRNTVSKAYQSLRRDGIVYSQRGVGVVVVKRPAEDRGSDIRLMSAVHTLLHEARLAGISNESLMELMATESRNLYTPPKVNVAFIECSPSDTAAMSLRLTHRIGVTVDPVDLGDFLISPIAYANAYRILTTTFFHLQEVIAAVVDCDVEVVGLHHIPSHKSILDLARLSPSTAIGVICMNERTLHKVEGVVRSYCDGEIIACTVDDDDCLERIVREVEVVVGHAQSHSVARQHAGELPVISVEFQPETQSVEYLQQQVKKALAETK